MIYIDIFNKLRYEGNNYGYFKTTKLSNNQTISIFFLKEELKRGLEYHVVLAISNKKKYIKQWIFGERDILSDRQTGKCGLEGLLWAKKQIIEFEKFLLEDKYSKDITICVNWLDNRRRKVYEYGLNKLGYSINYRYNSKCLSKKII